MAATTKFKLPEIITDKFEMRSWSRSQKLRSKILALVPTMGFLHEGHLALVCQAQALADLTVVSIYLNPGQFAPSEDLSTYPSDLAGDIKRLTDIGVDAIFCPQNLYDYGPGTVPSQLEEGGGKMVSCVESEGDGGGLGHESWIRVERLEKGLCGKSRPMFFRGVATVVAKLFNIVEPDFAVFGKKDYQQWRVICRMALSINKSLSEAKRDAQNGQNNCHELKYLIIQCIAKAGGRVDYVEIVEQETLRPMEEVTRPVVICVAAWFGHVRLIDNMEINI